MNCPNRTTLNKDDNFICGVIEGFYGRPWTFDQRRDLFKRLKKLNLNAYMYAPKDDTKHRANWRQLYSEHESNQLKLLISEANENGVDFYYSLAPGLDMVYSDEGEVELLIKKYNQVVELGCKSFAILFDDIEPSLINEKDKKVFKTYASAQVFIANMLHDYLKRPKFLFCPTEYCESRAVPDVTSSSYLNTIGKELNEGIDFLWSGSRVISRLITEESIEELSKVIRRAPVIWENLHANDYDKKRVFLGPYSGRSTKIIPKIKGVMTNPNCEYEANFVAIHTLAQWSRCTEDTNLHNRCNLDKKLNVDDESISNIRDSIYNPERALIFAIKDWLPHLLEHKNLPSGICLSDYTAERSDVAASNQLVKDEEINKDVDVEESNVDMLPEETQSSATSNSTNKSEMDMSSSPAPVTNLVDANSCESCDMPDASESSTVAEVARQKNLYTDGIMCQPDNKQQAQKSPTSVEPLKEPIKSEIINASDLSLLIDLFYLPFEHGLHGCNLLKDIKWLRDSSDILIMVSDSSKGEEIQMKDVCDEQEEENKTIATWNKRAEKLNNFCTYICRLVNNLIYDCPNKLLIIELYPYLADMRDAASLVIDYINFLRRRSSLADRFYYSNASKQKELTALSDEQEPWVHRGGLIGDVQRILSA